MKLTPIQRAYLRVQQRKWRAEHPGYYQEFSRRRYQNSKHPCADCGILVSPAAVRCVPCANRNRRRGQ